MSIVVELTSDLEQKLSAEASRLGLPLADYVLKVLANGGTNLTAIHNGSALVSYWQQEGLIGTRSDIADSQSHARDLRAEAERRERS